MQFKNTVVSVKGLNTLLLATLLTARVQCLQKSEA